MGKANNFIRNIKKLPQEDTRKPASIATLIPVATVTYSSGDVRVVRDRIESPLTANQKVFNLDRIETGEEGKVKIAFVNSNTLTLAARSKSVIHYQPMDEKHQADSTVVQLLFGTVRSVIKKTASNDVKYRVETPSATAGVRGTDFLTTYYQASHTTKVQTFEGTVDLSSLKMDRKTSIPGGYFASYVVDTENTDSDHGSSMNYVSQGFITPLEKMSERENEIAREKTSIEPSRTIAVAPMTHNDDPICQKPIGKFNQCAWTCVGGRKKMKECVTPPHAKQEVRCVRERCNANGVWAEETRLPANNLDKCRPGETLILPCDY